MISAGTVGLAAGALRSSVKANRNSIAAAYRSNIVRIDRLFGQGGRLMVKTASTMKKLGTPAPDFQLMNVDGRLVKLDDFWKSPALLVIFMCNHCPFVKHVAEGLAKLASDYRPQGVAIVGINSNDA